MFLEGMSPALKKLEIQDIYQNKTDKADFQRDMAYGDFKKLPKRTASHKLLCENAFDIAKNTTSIVLKSFDKKSLQVVLLKVKLLQVSIIWI